MYMEGILWKWTNYLSGWQARWFVLENGILSYYKSQEDVGNGCKGSVKLSVCDIAVHHTDRCRLDLIIPGEQHYYIRAATSQERQQWLVGLGSAKASMLPGRTSDESGSLSPDIVKSKKSELRLYCDLLMQQVHTVKMAIQQPNNPDVDKLNEATSLLGPTCDTFIQTLEDCMKLVQVSIAYEGTSSPHPHVSDSALPPSPLKLPSKKNRAHVHRRTTSDSTKNIQVHSAGTRSSSASTAETTPVPRTRQISETLSDHSPIALQPSKLLDNPHDFISQNTLTEGAVQLETSDSPSGQKVSNSSLTGSVPVPQIQNGIGTDQRSGQLELNSNTNSTPTDSRSSTADNEMKDGSIRRDSDVFLDPIEDKIPTFFSEMKPSFMDIKLESDGGIPVEEFLTACKSLVPMFDKLNSTAFAPVKMDFQGNIRKVKQKYTTNPEGFPTLQSIILSEVEAKQHTVPSSATMALLWLKRSLEFILGLLQELKQEDNLGTAASKAYANSLKPYHGWVVRGVFAVAVKALPYKRDFLSLLGASDEKMEGPMFERALMSDVESFGTALEVNMKILKDFYTMHGLDLEDKI